MARVTVEDCVLQVPNRFNLVMLAAHRARALGSGAELKVGRDRDKNPVVSLREIAEEKLDLTMIEESLIKSLQKRIEPERPEDEIVELIAGEQHSWVNNMDSSADDMDDDEDLEADADEEAETAEGDFGTFEDADIKD